MKRFIHASRKYLKGGRALSSAPFLLSLCIGLLSGLMLFGGVLCNLVSFIIQIGFDPLRAQLIAALLLTAGGSLIGAFVGQRKLGALLGATIIFCSGYLLGFIELETRPTYDAGGHLEPLNTAALVHTSFVMLALGLLCAFSGAAIGVAFAEVLLHPVYQLGRSLWNNYRHKNASLKQPFQKSGQAGGFFASLRMTWLGVLSLLVVLVLATGGGDLFLYSPDTGLHLAPEIASRQSLPAHGTIVRDSLISPALGGQRRTFLIYLPPSYNTPQGRTRRYPTLYLLHGSPGGERDWFSAGKANESADTLIALGKIPELIIVSPDGNGFEKGPSEWGNSADQRQLMETFVARDLVNYVDAKYRTIPEAAYRGIGGLSMGGFGAANIGIHHPDVFGFVISLGGYFHAQGLIWGNNPAYIRENSPATVLLTDKAAWSLQFYLADGIQDHPYYEDTLQFVKELAALHISYHFDRQNGYHSWTLWQAFLYKALLWLHWGT